MLSKAKGRYVDVFCGVSVRRKALVMFLFPQGTETRARIQYLGGQQKKEKAEKKSDGHMELDYRH